MNFKRQKLDDVGVNLTPLIDVVFLLLIFFMVSTTFTKENRLSLELPEASGEQLVEAQTELLEIVINAQGHYTINKQSLTAPTLANLKTVIKELSKGDTSVPIVITADAKATHQAVIRAMDAAGQLGFASLSLTTRQPQQPEG